MAENDPDEYVPKELPNDSDILSHINKNETDMFKKIRVVLAQAEKEIGTAVTPAEKAAILEDAKAVINTLFVGEPVIEALADMVINHLEKQVAA
ncbi:hypothetical protein [uncultured Mucilaginibacter sp.]|uniref:hypothetical protein n=1 Tax=uncultured Mucilaginibacter sp. TaxID=797541 RepID=UPI0025F58923|nr:hypothetical protein [uncultured Mucilaginibacter sp.]